MKPSTPLMLASFALVTLCAAVAQIPQQQTGGDKAVRLRYALAGIQDPAGTSTPYENWAAYPWHPSSKVPDRPDGVIDPVTGKRALKWPMLAYYPAGTYPSIVWYYDGAYRASSGYKWGAPERWAYVRYAEEVWNSATKQFDVPGLTPAPVPPAPTATEKSGVHLDDVAGQQLVDILKRSFTWTKIQDFGDLSPYDEPDTGAPEDAPGAPPL